MGMGKLGALDLRQQGEPRIVKTLIQVIAKTINEKGYQQQYGLTYVTTPEK